MGSLTRQTFGLAALLGLLGWILLRRTTPTNLGTISLCGGSSFYLYLSAYLSADHRLGVGAGFGLCGVEKLKNLLAALSCPPLVMLTMLGGILVLETSC